MLVGERGRKVRCVLFFFDIIRIISELWSIDRDKIIVKLNECGIGTSVHYIPVHMHSYYFKKYGFKPSDFPNANTFSKTVISLPLYPAMSDKQVDFVISKICEIWYKYKL